MFAILAFIVSSVIALPATIFVALTFFVTPWFARKILTYEYEESVPVINGKVADSELAVTFHGVLMSNPHVISLKLQNTGRADVTSAMFDQATPISFDLGVQVAAILHVSYRPPSMRSPNVALVNRALSIGPSFIPHGAVLEWVLLVDDSCEKMTCTHSLEGVNVKRRIPSAEWKSGIRLRVILTYTCFAFLIWWAIQQPTAAAHLLHNIGNVLSSSANELSRFVASI